MGAKGCEMNLYFRDPTTQKKDQCLHLSILLEIGAKRGRIDDLKRWDLTIRVIVSSNVLKYSKCVESLALT